MSKEIVTLKHKVQQLGNIVYSQEEATLQSDFVLHGLRNRLAQRSRCVLSSASFNRPPLPSNPNKEAWKEVQELKRQLQDTIERKRRAEQQLKRQQKWVEELETRLEENKDLVDEVARYEAELSITKAMFFFKEIEMKNDKGESS
ncbi:hypothetical protein EC973_003975 [Apophysomyces ossiformis]|uniref:Uncharacterized protein n=1 Tax=Apophysomyces ossiformis TaxID=679940 RepID=A0A8H7EM06_9FUNG|nr:hypothetical protein EC973_003975 [Apophysomyces ossiformis]